MVLGTIGAAVLECEEKWVHYCRAHGIINPYTIKRKYCYEVFHKMEIDVEMPSDEALEEYDKRHQSFMMKEMYNLLGWDDYVYWLKNTTRPQEVGYSDYL